MNRLEEIRKTVDNIILNIKDDQERRDAYIHLYEVSNLSALLAMKRGTNTELAYLCGILHDVYRCKTGIAKDHAVKGAIEAKKILEDSNLFGENEINIIKCAIHNHSDKSNIQDVYDEILKDADVLQHYLYNTSLPVKEEEKQRLCKILKELGMDKNIE